ncbi:MAG: hypothetical protein QE284_20135 [Rhizobium sp.]|nr:hypothetical protein [Rhizobium sp.]
MGLMYLVDTLSRDPVAALKTTLRIVHFIGLALGLGAATVLDLMILKFFLKGKVTSDQWNVFHFGTRIVNAGLLLLWLTGLGFLTYYAAFEPIKLGNDKVWAKMTIVLILSINGAFLHAVVLPKMKAQIGRSLFDGMSTGTRNLLFASGALSATSWYVPLLLGALPQLNFVIPMTTILLAYALILAVAFLATQLVLLLLPEDRTQTSPSRPLHRIEPMMAVTS